ALRLFYSSVRFNFTIYRIKKSLYISIITLLMTLSGPVQAVTASQLINQTDDKSKTNLRLPNEGRSDLQELIHRVDAKVGDDSEEPSPDPEADETEVVEPPAADSDVPEPEANAPETTNDQKPVVQAKAPRAITTNTNGTSTWTFESNTGLLVFGAGTLSEAIRSNLTNAGVAPTAVKSISIQNWCCRAK
ncbi:MAG: hypothetical protein ACTINX_07235, partial [Leuconostoc falkenbergense]